MDVLVPNNLLLLGLYIVIALFIGYAVGSRYSRKQTRTMLHEYNQQSLDMLDIKSDHAKLSKFLGQSVRKDRLLKLTLKQLKESNQRSKLLQARLSHIEKQHYIKTSRMRLLATHASEKARRATLIATRATKHLKRIEKSLPKAQAIKTPPPKSYRQANLQAIDGIDPSVEKKLNQIGIHRVEQLAYMSDSDLIALSVAVGSTGNSDDQLNYTAAWKGGAQRLLSQL